MNSSAFNIFQKSSSGQKAQKIEHVDFSSPNCCNDVDRLLVLNTGNPVECEDILRALTVLASQVTNRQKFINLETLARVFKAIGTHIGKVAIVEWGLRALTAFASDERAVPKILQYEGCQVLTIVIRRYPSKDAIVEEACRSIFHLTEASQSCKQLFLDAGIVEVLAVNILADPSCTLQPTTLEWCLRAIGGLARRHAQAKLDFANCGVCESIVPVAKSVPIKNQAFAEAACWVIGNLSYPDVDNQTRLCACGAAEFLVSVLIQHLESGLLIQEVFRGIRNLCYQHEENCARFVAADICIALVHAITFHIHKGIEIGAVKETLSEKVDSLKSSMIPNFLASSIVSGASATMSSLSKGTSMIGISAGISSAPASSSGSGSVSIVTEANLEATATRGAVQWGWYAVAGLAQNRDTVKAFLTTNVIKVLKSSLERYGVLEGAAQWTCHAAGNLARDPDCAALLGNSQLGILQALCNVRVHRFRVDYLCLFICSFCVDSQASHGGRRGDRRMSVRHRLALRDRGE